MNTAVDNGEGSSEWSHRFVQEFKLVRLNF